MKRGSKRGARIMFNWIAILVIAVISSYRSLGYTQHPTENKGSSRFVIPQSAPGLKKAGPTTNSASFLPTGEEKINPVRKHRPFLWPAVIFISPPERRGGYPAPKEPSFLEKGDKEKNNPSAAKAVNPDPKKQGTENTYQSTQLNKLIDSYKAATDTEKARAILNSIVELVKDNSSLKDALTQKLKLTGETLKIWNNFNVLVLSSGARENFSEAELKETHSVLKTLPEESVKLINVITTASASEATDNNLLGFTYIDPNKDVIVINRSSSYFSGAEGLQTLAETLCHEVGHRVQLSSSLLKKLNFYKLHLASGNDVQNYARAYGMTDYGAGDIGYEDFATMYEAWCTDSVAILARARSQANQGSAILLEKVKFMASLFAHKAKDSQTYTYIFLINSDGSISRKEVRLRSDGLPVL